MALRMFGTNIEFNSGTRGTSLRRMKRGGVLAFLLSLAATTQMASGVAFARGAFSSGAFHAAFRTDHGHIESDGFQTYNIETSAPHSVIADVANIDSLSGGPSGSFSVTVLGENRNNSSHVLTLTCFLMAYNMSSGALVAGPAGSTSIDGNFSLPLSVTVSAGPSGNISHDTVTASVICTLPAISGSAITLLHGVKTN